MNSIHPAHFYSAEITSLHGLEFRHPMPSFVCPFCVIFSSVLVIEMDLFHAPMMFGEATRIAQLLTFDILNLH